MAASDTAPARQPPSISRLAIAKPAPLNNMFCIGAAQVQQAPGTNTHRDTTDVKGAQSGQPGRVAVSRTQSDMMASCARLGKWRSDTTQTLVAGFQPLEFFTQRFFSWEKKFPAIIPHIASIFHHVTSGQVTMVGCVTQNLCLMTGNLRDYAVLPALRKLRSRQHRSAPSPD